MVSIYAYIDPGSGSLIWQSITATFIGGLFYLRRFILKIKRRRRTE